MEGEATNNQGAAGSMTMPPSGDAGAPDEFIRIPKSSLGEYGGDWHKVVEQAKTARELGDYSNLARQLKAQGYTGQQIEQYLFGEPESRSQPPITPTAVGPSAEDIQRIVQEQVGSLKNEFGQTVQQALRQFQTQTQQQFEQQQRQRAARELIHKGGTEFLESLGVKLEDANGEINPYGEALYNQFYTKLVSHMRDNMPDDVRQKIDAERDPSRRAQLEQDYFDGVSDDHVKAASESMAWARNLKYQQAAAVAAEQQKQPSDSLSGGAGGTTKTPYSEMSHEDRMDTVMANVPLD